MSHATSRLIAILAANRGGAQQGITSVCSAHPLVIRAALELARERGQLALIEATCNQVNQFGGYTGMQPADFARRVRETATNLGLGEDDVILGGDHLGPQPWRREHAETAMAKAVAMVEAFVGAGFAKIHLDCSMRCADDPEILPEAVIAERAARLAEAAEGAAGVHKPVYIIGTEVPPPGGMGAGHAIVPTDPAHVQMTLDLHRQAFAARGLEEAFGRVVGMVVQPGVDFGNEEVVYFDPSGATALSRALDDAPGLVFEAHSTDYQRPEGYKALVAHHFAILKVGPAASFALREALYGLQAVEAELVPAAQRSGLRAALEAAMLARPGDWSGHYDGTPEHQAYLRHFSYSDRLRYYWTEPGVVAAVEQLFANLERTGLPLPLVSQYLPLHYGAIASGALSANAPDVAVAQVKAALAPYADASLAHQA